MFSFDISLNELWFLILTVAQITCDWGPKQWWEQGLYSYPLLPLSTRPRILRVTFFSNTKILPGISKLEHARLLTGRNWTFTNTSLHFMHHFTPEKDRILPAVRNIGWWPWSSQDSTNPWLNFSFFVLLYDQLLFCFSCGNWSKRWIDHGWLQTLLAI